MHALTLNRLIDFTETSGLYHTNQLFKKKCFSVSTGEWMEKKSWTYLFSGREYVVKKEVEVKEYLRQLLVHSAMLSLCKSPNLHDSWGIKKERSKPENQGPLILLWQWIRILCDTGWITMPLLSVPLILNAWRGRLWKAILKSLFSVL